MSPSPPPYTESAATPPPIQVHVQMPMYMPGSPLHAPATSTGPMHFQFPQSPHSYPHPHMHPHSHLHDHIIFGPTPLIPSSPPLVPYAYHDPRSLYALAQADARARQRFVLTILWAIIIWGFLGLLFGAEIDYYINNVRRV